MVYSSRPVVIQAIVVVCGLILPGVVRGEQFIVAELPGSQNHLDSFVITLSDPGNIAHARDLIARGPTAGSTIVAAQIAAGSDRINRDYLAPGAPLWSWHVVGEPGFADFAIELYDGWPGQVESDVAGWIRNTGGRIAFWNYTVVSEIAALDVPEPASLISFAVGLVSLLIFARSKWPQSPSATG